MPQVRSSHSAPIVGISSQPRQLQIAVATLGNRRKIATEIGLITTTGETTDAVTDATTDAAARYTDRARTVETMDGTAPKIDETVDIIRATDKTTETTEAATATDVVHLRDVNNTDPLATIAITIPV